MLQKCPKSLCGGGGGVGCVGKPNLVKCFGPRFRLWTWTLDFVPGPSFSKPTPAESWSTKILVPEPSHLYCSTAHSAGLSTVCKEYTPPLVLHLNSERLAFYA